MGGTPLALTYGVAVPQRLNPRKMQDRIDRLDAEKPGCNGCQGRIEIGCCRFRHIFGPKSGKPDFGAPRSGFTP